MGFEYTVAQGDCLSSIAAQFGLADWRTIYDHPNNAAHRRRRPDPNLLFPGDRLFIPQEAAVEAAGTDTRHRFRKSAARVALRLAVKDVLGRPVAGRPYRLQVGLRQFSGVTGGGGEVEHEIPADASTGELFVAGEEGSNLPSSETWTLRLGHLDPVDTVSGVQARLNNLGYDAGLVDGVTGPRTRGAVALFQREHGLFVDGIAGPRTQAKLAEIHGC